MELIPVLVVNVIGGYCREGMIFRTATLTW